MTEKSEYQAPSISEIGTVHELTLQRGNKMGPDPDVYSQVVPIVGSITPAP